MSMDFLCVFFPPWPKLCSLEMLQQHTADILPLWNSSGKSCNLTKHHSPLTGISVDLQSGDQKHTVNSFGLAQKAFSRIYASELICLNNLLKKLEHFVHIHLVWGSRMWRVKWTQLLSQRRGLIFVEWVKASSLALTSCLRLEARHWNSWCFNFHN